MFLEKKEEKVDDGRGGHRRVTKETMIFPRYHQLDAVRKLVTAARGEGPGRNYLIQHSAAAARRTASPGFRTGLPACTAKRTRRSSTAWS